MKPTFTVLAIAAVLAVGAAITAGATPATVRAHGIATEMSGGEPVGSATDVSTDDIVYAWARLGETAGGETLRWQFEWPTGNTSNVTATVTGDGYYHARMDLDRYPTRETVGDWSVTLYLNGASVGSDTFVVEPLGGLLWWGPILGALLLIGFLAAVGYLGYRVLRRFRASKTHG